MNYFVFFAVLLLAAVYIEYPGTEFSAELTNWANQGKFMIIKGQRIFYVDQTSKLAAINETLLCIHGFPTSSYDFHKIWSSLTSKFSRVVAFDLIGLGLSDKPQKKSFYSIAEHATMVEKVIENLHDVGGVHIMAQDIGVTIVQELLARASENATSIIIKSVCFLNGGLFPQTNHPFLLQKLIVQPYIGQVIVRLLNRFIFIYKFNQLFGESTEELETNARDYWSLLRFRDGHLILPHLLQYMEQRWRHKERLTLALQQTHVPLHMIYGASDPINPPDFIPYLRSMVPNMSVDVIEGEVGHFPHLEQASLTFKYFCNFFKTLPRI